MTDLRKAAEMALEEFELFFNTYPYMEKGYTLDARKALRQALAQQEHEPVDKSGSPCPEFWDWLPKAYKFDGDGSFTKYNMEVAFLAGKQSITQQPPIAFMGTDFEGNPTKFRLNHFSGSFPLYTAPPKREWVGLTDDDVHDAFNYVEMVKLLDFDRDRPEWCEAFASACETRLRHKNGGNK